MRRAGPIHRSSSVTQRWHPAQRDAPALVTFGHVRQLDRVAETPLIWARVAGTGPGGHPS
jgi:hypothetical protein